VAIIYDPDTFVITIFSHNSANPNLEWRNSFNVQTAPDGSIAPGDAVVGALQQFIAGTQRNDSKVFKTTCRKWSRGAGPFFANPALWDDFTELVGYGYSDAGFVHGTAVPNGAPTVGEVVVRMAKQNSAPALRAPSIFLRNVIRNEDLLTVAGGPPSWKVDVSGYESLLNTFAETILGPYIGPPSGFPFLTNVEYSAKHSIGPNNIGVRAVVFKAVSMHDLGKSERGA